MKSCESCQPFAKGPQHSHVSGIRALNFGDVWFIDHTDIRVDDKLFTVLIVIDGASNYLAAFPQKDSQGNTTLEVMEQAMTNLHATPKTIVGDMAFHTPIFSKWYSFHGIKPMCTGPYTPWPNRAETAIRLFKQAMNIMLKHVRTYGVTTPGLLKVSFYTLASQVANARNTQLTYGGRCPLEIAFGQRPRDVLDPENMTPEQLTASVSK